MKKIEVCICCGFNLAKKNKVRLLKQECGSNICHLFPFQTNVMDRSSTIKDAESCWDTLNWVCSSEVGGKDFRKESE